MTHTDESDWTLVASETTTYYPTLVRPARGTIRRMADCQDCGSPVVYRVIGTGEDAARFWEHWSDGSLTCQRAHTVRHSV